MNDLKLKQLLFKIPLFLLERTVLYQSLFGASDSPYCNLDRFRLCMQKLLGVPCLEQEQIKIDREQEIIMGNLDY